MNKLSVNRPCEVKMAIKVSICTVKSYLHFIWWLTEMAEHTIVHICYQFEAQNEAKKIFLWHSSVMAQFLLLYARNHVNYSITINIPERWIILTADERRDANEDEILDFSQISRRVASRDKSHLEAFNYQMLGYWIPIFSLRRDSTITQERKKGIHGLGY